MYGTSLLKKKIKMVLGHATTSKYGALENLVYHYFERRKKSILWEVQLKLIDFFFCCLLNLVFTTILFSTLHKCRF